MSRKYLGVDLSKTCDWLVHAKNCMLCVEGARLATNDNTMWPIVQAHLTGSHISEEYCLTCWIWIEDDEFEHHLSVKHDGKPWEGASR